MDAMDRQTISDFGEQWTRYRDNSGFYGSRELFADIVGPLLPAEALRGARVADIGSGTGRIVHMLLDCGVSEVIAIEPSDAFHVLVENTAAQRDRVRCLNIAGNAIPADIQVDVVVSIGVLHHIHEPSPVVDAAWRALRPGGRILVWLYGKEGNEAYLRMVQPLRRMTTALPHPLLSGISSLLNLGLDVYIPLARRLPLPLAGYMREVVSKLTRDHRKLVIYDQLNPAFAHYYSEGEARRLLERAGFLDVQLHHRHGYSWTVSGRKPA